MERSAARSIPEMHIVDGMSNGWSHLGVASEGGFVGMSKWQLLSVLYYN